MKLINSIPIDLNQFTASAQFHNIVYWLSRGYSINKCIKWRRVR